MMRPFSLDDLVAVTDASLVECLGGPDDGEFRRADENGCRLNGMYVVVNGRHADGAYYVAARRYVPS